VTIGAERHLAVAEASQRRAPLAGVFSMTNLVPIQPFVCEPMSNSLRLKLTQQFLWAMGIFLLFWWPLSHWFYPDWYHRLLGFEPGSYQDNLVKIIGTLGVVPVLLIFFSAAEPGRNKHMIFVLIGFSLAMAATYLHLIASGQLPGLEIVNVTLSLFSALILTVLYPWKMGAGERP
jgi:hypothetical protein